MLDQQPVETLPVLGEDISLAEHMKANFFDVVASPERELWEFTAPVLLKRSLLERLGAWDEWRTLEGFLAGIGLHPITVFQNEPHSSDYFVTDVRAIVMRDSVFAWGLRTERAS